jgi:hypothetical protein
LNSFFKRDLLISEEMQFSLRLKRAGEKTFSAPNILEQGAEKLVEFYGKVLI